MIAPFDAGPDVVWGFADLHAHPAIEKAFNASLVWGSAVDPGPLDPNLLPPIAGCPVETHTLPGVGPIDRAIGAQVYPNVSEVAGFAHAPVGSDGLRPTSAWPNARDVVHQQMNVASIRRAYEGGLRLMFASTTDDQVISALLSGPNFVNAFAPKERADLDSARRQLAMIAQLAHDHAGWLGIARSPAEARALIRAGKLALVLSVEMNGLPEDGFAELRRDFGVQHAFPIHLVDNAIGGTAASSPLFNAASAAVSSLYRSDGRSMQYMDLEGTRDFPAPLGRPVTFATLDPPVYADLKDVPFGTWQQLCYEPLAACDGPDAGGPVGFTRFGQQNLRGLCRDRADCDAGTARVGAQRLQALFDDHWLVDLSHMSFRAAAQTLALRPGYPLMASHSDIAHLCRGAPTLPPCVDSTRAPLTERQLDSEQARALVRDDGVLGLGTGVGNFVTRARVVARGAPVLTLAPHAPSGCVQLGEGPGDCARAPDFARAPRSMELERLQVETHGALDLGGADARPYVRVELRDAVADDEFQHRVKLVPLHCEGGTCSAEVELGCKQGALAPPRALCSVVNADAAQCSTARYTVADVEDVTVQWLSLSGAGQCAAGFHDEGPRWVLDDAQVTAMGPAGAQPLVTLDGSPLATLAQADGALTLYQHDDRPDAAPGAPISGRLFVASLHSSPNGKGVLGASPQRFGANVCIALRTREGGTCRGPAALAEGENECVGDWVSLTQRGAWNHGGTLFTFLRHRGTEEEVCGLDVSVRDWLPGSDPLGIDSIRVAAVEDPVGHWVRRYAEVARHVAAGRMGVVAMGTDFNGLNGVTDISELPVPAAALLPQVCRADAGVQAVAPLRLRTSGEAPGAPVLIEERGLATYGLLQDFVSLVDAYPGCGHDVRNSLMLSAEATLRSWEIALDAGARGSFAPLPVGAFRCDGGAP
ncbi:MAG: hypothetical protein IPJ65_37525 [Archangiaceae bacterium]|nr:hypothetical protein [Archangiaceae bacterium]